MLHRFGRYAEGISEASQDVVRLTVLAAVFGIVNGILILFPVGKGEIYWELVIPLLNLCLWIVALVGCIAALISMVEPYSRRLGLVALLANFIAAAMPFLATMLSRYH